MNAPWPQWDESWRERSTQRGTGGICLHYLQFLVIGGAESYVAHMVRALYEWDHHIIIDSNWTDETMRQALLQAGAKVYQARDHCVCAHVASLRPDAVVNHAWNDLSRIPSRLSTPGPKYTAVYHNPRPGWVAGMHNHVCVCAAGLQTLPPPLRDKATLIHGCVDVGSITATKLAQDDPARLGSCVIGRYGSDLPEKYPSDLAEIFESVISTATRGIIVGDTPKEQFRARGLLGKVSFVPPSITARFGYLQQMDCAIYRNAEHFVEGYSLAIAEMMAAAIPVVSEARGGNVEQVEDGITGFLVPYGDRQQFIDRLKWLRDNPKERVAMGQAARAKAMREMGLDVFRTAWLGVLQ